MIIFLKVSARRHMVLDVPDRPTGWMGFANTNNGLCYSRASVIAGPASWSECRVAVEAWGREHNQLVPFTQRVKEEE